MSAVDVAGRVRALTPGNASLWEPLRGREDANKQPLYQDLSRVATAILKVIPVAVTM